MTRAADDFPAIRARMHELQGARPRAADDFPAIRACMEELRRQRSPSGDEPKRIVPRITDGAQAAAAKQLPAPCVRRLIERGYKPGRG